MADLFVARGLPDYIRSDNGPEFTAKQLQAWLERLGMDTLFIEPGSPWENAIMEGFFGTLKTELVYH